MEVRFRKGWFLLVAIASLGCRAPHAVDELERELRFHEDKIFQLQAYVEQYQHHMEDCRQENERLRKKLADGGGGGNSDGGYTPPRIEIPGATEGGPPPVTFPGEASESRPGGPQLVPARMTSEREPAALESSVLSSQKSVAESQEADDPMVVALTLNHLLTGGVNLDGADGDDGLMVLIEPRNAAGQVVPPEGELSLALIDPAGTTAEEARIARWDLSAEEADEHFHRSAVGDGVRLELPWQKRPPSSTQLHLYVRMITPDGEKLLTDRVIDVDLPGGSSRRRELSAAAPRKYTDNTAPRSQSKSWDGMSGEEEQREPAWSKRKRAIPQKAYPKKPAPKVATSPSLPKGEPAESETDETGQGPVKLRKKEPEPKVRQTHVQAPEWSPYR